MVSDGRNWIYLFVLAVLLGTISVSGETNDEEQAFGPESDMSNGLLCVLHTCVCRTDCSLDMNAVSMLRDQFNKDYRSLQELCDLYKLCGIETERIPYKEGEAVDNIQAPWIASMNDRRFVVVDRIEGGDVSLYDPPQGYIVLKFDEFLKTWTKQGIFIAGRKGKSGIEIKNPFNGLLFSSSKLQYETKNVRYARLISYVYNVSNEVRTAKILYSMFNTPDQDQSIEFRPGEKTEVPFTIVPNSLSKDLTRVVQLISDDRKQLYDKIVVEGKIASYFAVYPHVLDLKTVEGKKCRYLVQLIALDELSIDEIKVESNIDGFSCTVKDATDAVKDGIKDLFIDPPMSPDRLIYHVYAIDGTVQPNDDKSSNHSLKINYKDYSVSILVNFKIEKRFTAHPNILNFGYRVGNGAFKKKKITIDGKNVSLSAGDVTFALPGAECSVVGPGLLEITLTGKDKGLYKNKLIIKKYDIAVPIYAIRN